MEKEDSPVLEEDPRDVAPGAVLLSDKIEYYSTKVEPPLIEPFHSEQLKPAGYRLSLGREARVGGKDVILRRHHPVELRPHQVAVVSTYEKLRIPRFLIARWNLRVSLVYEGLLWVGALQVDPGWDGPLFAPIYNLGEKSVYLNFRDNFFTMDFVRTTPYREGVSKKITFNRKTLKDHDQYRLHSAPYESLQELEHVKDQVDGLQRVVATFVTITVVVLAAIIAAVAVTVTDPIIDPGDELMGGWPLAALVFSSFAAVLSLATLAWVGFSRWDRGDHR